MAGKIIADQIEHSTAGSLDTSYVVNGSAKYWVDFNGSGTVAVRDSLNHASLVDGGTGIFTISYTNSFNNANYCAVGGQSDNNGTIAVPRQTYDLATGSTMVRTTNGASANDAIYNHVAIFGDLA
jgi:hypothetical protein